MSLRESERSKNAVINAALSGANIIVPVAAGVRLLVISYALVATGAVDATWKSEATALTGAMSIAANGGISASGSREDPLLKTLASGNDLILTLSGTVQVSGHLTYILIPA